MTLLAVLGLALAAVSLIRTKIETWPLTPPMLFVAIGMMMSQDVTGWSALDLSDDDLAFGAEITLALVLFSDAARINVRELLTSVGLPARLLGIGLPLSVVVGTMLTAALLTDLSLAEAALIAAILAPTDAALGEAVISNPAVPNVIRQSLNVESGLNDGLIVPVVAIFVTLAIGHELDEPATLVARALGEVGLALVVGALVAVVLARVITVATRRSLTSDAGLRLVGFGGALAAFAGSTAIGGNGFVAAFGCGLVARYLIGESVTDHTELVEDLSHVGASATFVLFGAVLVWPALQDATPLVFLCAIATLTLGRMVPVALAMLGSGFKVQTVAFVGWFGPRGLASMLFGLLLVAEGELEVADELFSVIALVVLLSVFLHGASAWRGAVKYGNWYASMSEDETMMESMECESTPVRWRRLSE